MSPTGQYLEFFSFELRDSCLDCLSPNKRKTIIFECEFLALLAALLLWAPRLTSVQTVCYIDNNSVRDAAISCSTSNAIGEAIMSRCLEFEDKFQLKVGLQPFHHQAILQIGRPEAQQPSFCV